MDYITLLRTHPTQNAKGIHGLIITKTGKACNTLELKWNYNKRSDSCIPTGSYVAQKSFSKKLGQTIKLYDVKHRSNILIHTGNYLSDTQGCILVGLRPKENTILDSSHAMRTLLNKIPDKFIIHIIDLCIHS